MPIAPVECLDELRLVVAATKHFDGIAVKLSRASKGERRYEGGTVCLLQVVEGEAICGMHQKDQVFAYDSDPLNIILINEIFRMQVASGSQRQLPADVSQGLIVFLG